MTSLANDKIRQAVRARYGKIAESDQPGCGCQPSACCDEPAVDTKAISRELGYSSGELNTVPEGANLGLGCGNPRAIASLKQGETVLDLGSGGGFDCFLAAKEVGASGHVIGVDMTIEMVTKARQNAVKSGYHYVDFRLGEIEHLPVADGCVDVIISNCVINLSPEKKQVFEEAFRVLKPGGRLAISDIVATAEFPEELKEDMASLTACISGASTISVLEATLKELGFTAIAIRPKDESREFILNWAPGSGVEDYIVSATIEAIKPGA